MRRLLEIARRLLGTVTRCRTDSDLQDELRLHLELAAEDERRRGDPADAARAARVREGGIPQAMETLRDQRGLPSLDALVADIVFGWRQLTRHRAASLSTILSLGLAMGATFAAFRLLDAVLLRPLPVANPSSLFVVTTTVRDADDQPEDRDDFDYPTYRRYVEAAGDRADLLLIGSASRRQILIDGEPEHAVQQFVSGNVFQAFGLQPALGRLLSTRDDETPDAHAVVVISHDFWRRRFGSDPAIAGRTFRIGSRPYEIVGVAPERFTGTEPGIVTDFFVPSMMNPQALDAVGWSWFRIWLRPGPGAAASDVEARLQALFQADHLERAKLFAPDTPQSRIDAYLGERLFLRPAGAGVSAIQKSFRRPLWILAALAALLLLIACANVASLLLARSMARRTEMALRLSIGAARSRLIQLMLVESLMLALFAGAAGAIFAAWAAPFIVSMLAPVERPVRLILDLDWRIVTIGVTVTLAVTILFGVVPALRASAVPPSGALRAPRAYGGQRRLTDALVAVQMALCVFLLFGASLFVGTFRQLQNKPLGFEPRNVIQVLAETRTPQAPEVWTQLAARLAEIPRVESAAVAAWAPLSGNRWRSSIAVPGRTSPALAPNWVNVSPGYFAALGTRMVDGREFRPGDLPPRRDSQRGPEAGVAIVNEAFARVYFDGRSPVGQRVIVDSSQAPMEIVGLSADAVYFSVREAFHPAVFVPLHRRDVAAFLIRTQSGDMDLRDVVRREIPRIQPEVRVHGAEALENLVTQQMVRERLLAALSTFFAALALLLAVIGTFGMLNCAVTRERPEIGLRMALGARPGHIVELLTRRLAFLVVAGAAAGVAGGLAFGAAVRTLLFGIEPNDPAAVAVPIAALAIAAACAAVPPALRAVRIDPAQTIRNDG